MNYGDLTANEQGLILLPLCLIFFFGVYCVVRIVSLGRRVTDLLLPGLVLLFDYVLFQILIMTQQGDIHPSFSIPLAFILSAMAVSLLYMLLLHYYVACWRKEHISAMSVKEAFDRLDTGLMFYTDSGIPVMINEAMCKAGNMLFGEVPADGCAFWSKLKGADLSGDGDESSVIAGKSGERMYNIRKREIRLKDCAVTELMALDISREYELTRELKRRQAEAAVLNSRLKTLMATIEYVTMNRELLVMKKGLHDNIGQSILSARRYLYSPHSVDWEHIRHVWQENIRHLIHGEPEAWELPYYVIGREADRLGIHLNILGELPGEQHLIPVVDAAVSVHIGNTLKHADGTEATVAVKKEGGSYILLLTNNGRQPEGEIREQGGLLNLRREVESIGGHMEVHWQPAFQLELVLPEEG